MRSFELYDLHVDVVGLHCPQPVINCKAALSKLLKSLLLLRTREYAMSVATLRMQIENVMSCLPPFKNPEMTGLFDEGLCRAGIDTTRKDWEHEED